jgi:ribonucleoside-triphosphate reductase (formate)
MNGVPRYQQIVKRNGEIVPFDSAKIEHAIFKAMRAVGKPNRKLANQLSSQVIENLGKCDGDKTPSVEQVQDIVERVLFQQADFDLIKAYLLYRKQREQTRNAKDLFSNIEVVDDYLSLRNSLLKILLLNVFGKKIIQIDQHE